MNKLMLAATLMVLTAAPALAENETPDSARTSVQESGTPIAKLIAVVAKKTGKKFVLDPRVRADVIIVGQDPSAVSYSDLLTIIDIYGFTAVEDGGYVQVVPQASIRTMPTPTIGEKESRPAAEYVTLVLTLKSVSAASIVPMLRPMLPQQAHLAALPAANQLVIVDKYSNVKRITDIVRAIDVGCSHTPHCDDGERAPAK